jgi:heat shock protein HslJ
MTFTIDQVQGSGGCNRFGGGYRYDESSGRIAFDRLAMTAMGCVDEHRGALETVFFQAVGQADRLYLDADGRLHLTGPGGEVVLEKAAAG